MSQDTSKPIDSLSYDAVNICLIYHFLLLPQLWSIVHNIFYIVSVDTQYPTIREWLKLFNSGSYSQAKFRAGLETEFCRSLPPTS